MGELTLPQNTFVLRFWWSIEWDAEPMRGRRWRGRVEHLQSGETLNFTDMEEMIAFVKRFMPFTDERAEDSND